MRIYMEENQKDLLKVICNQCQKELIVEKGLLKAGCFEADTVFGYFSDKDGMKYSFDLCEECYDIMISGFAIPVKKEEIKELL